MTIDIEKIKPYPAITVLSILGTISPGYLWLYIYNKQLFLSLDFIKLTALVLGITVPSLIFMIAISLAETRRGNKVKKLKKEEAEEDKDEIFMYSHNVYFASIWTITSLGVSILSGYFFDYEPALGVFVYLLSIIIATFASIINVMLKDFHIKRLEKDSKRVKTQTSKTTD
jgi:uncharacterized membrane protein